MAARRTVAKATEESIAAAVADGTVDPKVSAGPLQALRELAARVDRDDERDNVSLPTYLRACEALRLTPASRGEVKEPAVGKLAKLRSLREADTA